MKPRKVGANLMHLDLILEEMKSLQRLQASLTRVKAMLKNPRWTRDHPHFGRGVASLLSQMEGPRLSQSTKPQASGYLGLWKESSNTDASSSIGRG